MSTRPTGQSRADSWAESAVNLAVGFVVSVLITLWLFPHLPMADNLQITAIFTVASLLRSYGLRRLFNRIATKEHT